MGSKRKKEFSRNLTRSNEDRIAYIHQQIRAGNFPTCAGLARDTGFSRYVILEDVRYLREFKNLPLKVSRQAGRSGYYYSHPVAEKIGSTFNEQGVMNIVLAHRAVATLPVKGEEKLGLDMETLSQLCIPHAKILLDELQETVFFRPFAPEEIDYPAFVTVSTATRGRHEVEFSYLKNLAQAPEQKRIRPYLFVCAANCWYLIGLDVEKNVERTYLLSRVSNPVIQKKHFKDPKFDLDEYLNGAFIVMKGEESHDIVVEFSPWARTYIANRRFTRDQKMEVLPNGGLRVSFWLSCLEEVEYWVRHWGPHVKVISSEALRERLRKYRDYLDYLG